MVLQLRISFFLFLFVSTFSLFSQHILLDDGCYIYGEERICDFDDLEPILATNLDAMYWLVKSRKSRSSARTMGIFSLAGLAGSYLMINSVTKMTNPTGGHAVPGLSLGLLACIVGLGGISELSIASNEEIKAIDTFNEGNDLSYYKKQSYRLSFGAVGNGFGLRLSF